MPSDQFLVFFNEYRQIDSAALAKFVRETDPDETEELELQTLEEQIRPAGKESRELGLGDEPLRMSGLLITLGEFSVSVLVHNVAAPVQLCIEESHLKPQLKERLAAHQAFALLTLTGGEQYRPMERVVLLAKIALGLCEQGAIGIGFPEGMTAIDAETFRRMASLMKEQGGSLWKSLREQAAPSILYSNKLLYEDEDRTWVVTFGYNILRLPDLAGVLSEGMTVEDMSGVLDDVLDFLLEKGPVLQTGQVISARQRPFAISEPPEGHELLKRELGMLVLRETKA